jgi:hypothetical protein
MAGAPLPGKRHWVFTPAPFCLAFETEAGWLSMGVEAMPGANRFDEPLAHTSAFNAANSSFSAGYSLS